MIKYTLKCGDGHAFDSWFASASAYDSLAASGHLACMTCGSTAVEKAVMTPRVSTSKAVAARVGTDQPEAPDATPSEVEAALSKMRAEVEKNAAYVGNDFARQARDMHLGDVPDKPIWGEANAKEAKALIEDGVPVAPLPFIPTRKVN
ncbi:DUF1178 family protein [uncultured Tateyamaria sp.]|uniref:DUF1178 family protein n=1 Tax=uncultured Tateyamaria sp. TaxID=455651 RepID=UPI00261FA7D3|nr:DUF1178 family protein [uncultured Tateyamaria sp.]